MFIKFCSLFELDFILRKLFLILSNKIKSVGSHLSVDALPRNVIDKLFKFRNTELD